MVYFSLYRSITNGPVLMPMWLLTKSWTLMPLMTGKSYPKLRPQVYTQTLNVYSAIFIVKYVFVFNTVEQIKQTFNSIYIN